jgi:hypothetical protein
MRRVPPRWRANDHRQGRGGARSTIVGLSRKDEDAMRIRRLLALLPLLLAPLAHAGEPVADAHRLVDEAMQAMGGRALSSIGTARVQAIVSRNMLEQSIRPEGPWIVDTQAMDLVLDFDRARVVETTTRQGRLAALGDPAEASPPVRRATAGGVAAMRVGDGAYAPASRAQLQDADDWLAFNPLRVLSTAAAARDLHVDGEAVRHGVAQRVLAWTRHDAPVRLYLDAATHLPSAVAWTAPRPADVFWGAWGDVATELSFENWVLLDDGLRMPTQWNFVRNGQPDRTLQVHALDRGFTPDEADWRFDDALRAKFAALPADIDQVPFGLPGQAPVALPGGGMLVPGRWNVAFVPQADGVVVIEVPISGGYSRQAIEAAQRMFPKLPVKAVVSTSDAWPHIAGLREYAARGIPIHLLDLDRPIVERLLTAPHAQRSDALARQPRDALLREVAAPTTLGKGEDRIVLLPLRTATGERQMLVAMPGRGLLYTSDLVQPTGDGGWYSPETRLELRTRLRALGLAPRTCFGMHYAPVPCASLLDGIPGAR